jgi:hypothetical protein
MADWVKKDIRPVLIPGTLVYAYALYWEAIVRLRQFINWSPEDSERFHFLMTFLTSRAAYSPSTFSHKALFLEGLILCPSYLNNIS